MTERIESLDTLKGFALLCVVYIHIMPFFSPNRIAEMVSYFFANLSRIGVPAFFLTSGYLTSQKLGDDHGKSFMKRQLKRIGKAYFASSFIYLLFILAIKYFKNVYGLEMWGRWLSLEIFGLEGLFKIFYTGRAVGDFLWFLTALFFSLVIIYYFNSRGRIGELLGASVLLHLLAIISNVYLVFEWIPIMWEDTLSVGLIFTVTGFYIGKNELESWKNSRTFLWLSIGFATLHLLEKIFITLTVTPWEAYYWNPYFWGTYSFFLAPMVISIFFYFLKNPELGKESRLNRYGKYTLTGYLIHPAVLGLYVGLGTAITALTGIPILNTLATNLVIFPIAYVTTMELTLWYRWR